MSVVAASFTLCSVFAGALVHGQAPAAAPAGTEPAVRGSLVEDRAAVKLVEAGDARFDADEFSKALEVWESVIERYPRSKIRFTAHMRLGDYLLKRERAFDRARIHFEAASREENPEEEQRAEATLNLGICFYEARNYGKCFTVMRDVVEKFPVSPQVNQAYYYIGLGHFQLGHFSRAIDALEKVGTTMSGGAGRLEKVEAGKRLFIKIDDADLAALEVGRAVRVQLESVSGDKEQIDCFAVGRNVRVVLGSILTSLGKPQIGNDRLEVRGDEMIKVTYLDEHTGDKLFNRPREKQIPVVGNAIAQITDGAFSETLRGVVLEKSVNLQITDADFDKTDAADTLKAFVDILREKTPEELEADAAKAPAATATEPAPEVNRFKRIDRIEVVFTEAKVKHDLPMLPKSEEEGKTPESPKKAPAKPADPAAANATPAASPTTPATTAAPNAAAPATATPATAAPADAPKADAAKSEKNEKGEAASADPTVKAKPAVEKSVEPAPPVDDGTIHSGVFRATIELAKAELPVEGDALLQALPGDVLQLTYNDERHTGEGPLLVNVQAKVIEGNLGGVRVTRAQISDQELRIQTQLKTASALTNIGNRYKEFGLKTNATGKYEQALAVCEDIMVDARALGGRLLEDTYVQLWQIYYEMDKLELAAAMCQRLQREFPGSGFVDDALLQMADVVRKQGNLQRAIGLYTQLVNMQTSQLRGEAQFGIAECYESMATAAAATPASAAPLFDRAFQEYKRVFDAFPESGRVGEAVAKMANYYYQQKDYARAVDIFETVLADHPDAKFLDVILFNYGRCLYRMERKAEARKQFDQLIAEFPESPLAGDAKNITEALAKAGF
ncbi:MAG: tetratricopeptide repeat protein [Planctomycetia bacterium]|nr:tetratricopeptide repeat protein [Planctomycetia bacterium]